MSEPGAGFWHIGVVVPAHDEDELLPGCLAALGTASAYAQRVLPGTRVTVLVVLDRCTDDSEAVCRRAAVTTLAVDAGSVGAARRLGVEAVQWPGPAHRGWLACTDADTEVPADWLVAQLRAADTGARLLLGAVEPDPTGVDPALLLAWHRLHPEPAGAADLRVHGANLGIRLDTYRRLGGFRDLAEHEDVDLVRRALAAGVRPRRGNTVRTSARTAGRTPGGFAGYLRALAITASGGGDDLERPA
ncbi:glycosyltransferase [Nocardioides acrostichi]|uniref:4,4'-diaponeurosporenoate glycosyltransferase n=1 Tax=Nocardioides acrostichi TaxID=2784339 RepID=A0A930Y718_9ACTN|nr:glycosyltransferase [Nocardioides acrostichi]MBF4161587.1 glycosyltransferase [Nocardioides acrostichi]